MQAVGEDMFGRAVRCFARAFPRDLREQRDCEAVLEPLSDLSKLLGSYKSTSVGRESARIHGKECKVFLMHCRDDGLYWRWFNMCSGVG